MPVDPTLTITIDRSGMPGALTDLVLSARLDGADFGITSYSPPDFESQNTYAADSPYTHGSEVAASKIAQGFLTFAWVPVSATTTAEVQVARDEIKAAIRQFSFLVTTKEGLAPAEVWAADPGSQRLAGGSLTRMVIKHLVPVYVVTIPVYPIPGA